MARMDSIGQYWCGFLFSFTNGYSNHPLTGHTSVASESIDKKAASCKAKPKSLDSFLLLVVRMLLVAIPGAPSSVLAPSI